MWSQAGTHFAAEGTNAAVQILSGLSPSMGLLSGNTFVRGSNGYADAIDNQTQIVYLGYDFGQLMRYPNVSGTFGYIKGVVTNDSLVLQPTPFQITDIGQIKAWMETDPSSPFSNNALYGTPMIDGYRIRIPVLLRTGLQMNANTSILIDLSSVASIDDEQFLAEPIIIQPINLIDPTTYTP